MTTLVIANRSSDEDRTVVGERGLSVTDGIQVPNGPDSPDGGANGPSGSQSGGFVHPGVLVSRPQLDFVRGKVEAGEQPWKAAYDQMIKSPYASPRRVPRPRAEVECGSHSNPDHGCRDEREDAIAAYTNALAWYLSKDERYAAKAIEIMDAWSGRIARHTNSNAPLQAGWAGSVWPRAAELIRHTYSRWSGADRFAGMLRTVYLPQVAVGSSANGNWELSMMEAAIGISVFLDDRDAYDEFVDRYLDRVRAFIYLKSDGDLPKTVSGGGAQSRSGIINYWQGQSTFVDGLSQETCRDFVHTGYGIAAIAHVAETSRIQGRDLYPQVGERLRKALGFHSVYQRGEPAPSWLCNGKLNLGLGPVTEIGFNAMSNRLGERMPNTQALTERQRPAGSNNLFVAWETLTHAGNPS
nr:alginate lyase family protein [Streptomyces sp. WAC 01325]